MWEKRHANCREGFRLVVHVKICGITNMEDALRAAELGADALGFIFAPSPRRIPPELAREITCALPPFVKTVGVFVDEELSTVQELMDRCGMDLAQLHGREPPEYCRELMPRALKAFRLKDASGLGPMEDYRGRVRGLLLDAYVEGMAGGTGKTFDWRLAREAGSLGIPLILSGGLGPANIGKAIAAVRPHAVDVNSGIELYPGKKDHSLMRQLMEKVRALNAGAPIHDEWHAFDGAVLQGVEGSRIQGVK